MIGLELWSLLFAFALHEISGLTLSYSGTHIILSQSVTLDCSLDGAAWSSSTQRQWFGPPPLTLMINNGVVQAGYAGYEEILDSSGEKFSLKIKSLSTTNLGQQYRCSYGFSLATYTLNEPYESWGNATEVENSKGNNVSVEISYTNIRPLLTINATVGMVDVSSDVLNSSTLNADGYTYTASYLVASKQIKNGETFFLSLTTPGGYSYNYSYTAPDDDPVLPLYVIIIIIIVAGILVVIGIALCIAPCIMYVRDKVISRKEHAHDMCCEIPCLCGYSICRTFGKCCTCGICQVCKESEEDKLETVSTDDDKKIKLKGSCDEAEKQQNELKDLSECFKMKSERIEPLVVEAIVQLDELQSHAAPGSKTLGNIHELTAFTDCVTELTNTAEMFAKSQRYHQRKLSNKIIKTSKQLHDSVVKFHNDKNIMYEMTNWKKSVIKLEHLVDIALIRAKERHILMSTAAIGEYLDHKKLLVPDVMTEKERKSLRVKMEKHMSNIIMQAKDIKELGNREIEINKNRHPHPYEDNLETRTSEIDQVITLMEKESGDEANFLVHIVNKKKEEVTDVFNKNAAIQRWDYCTIQLKELVGDIRTVIEQDKLDKVQLQFQIRRVEIAKKGILNEKERVEVAIEKIIENRMEMEINQSISQVKKNIYSIEVHANSILQLGKTDAKNNKDKYPYVENVTAATTSLENNIKSVTDIQESLLRVIKSSTTGEMDNVIKQWQGCVQKLTEAVARVGNVIQHKGDHTVARSNRVHSTEDVDGRQKGASASKVRVLVNTQSDQSNNEVTPRPRRLPPLPAS